MDYSILFINFASICIPHLKGKVWQNSLMAAPDEKSNFHVLVVGAGSVGLLIAQRLKMVLKVLCSNENSTSTSARVTGALAFTGRRARLQNVFQIRSSAD